MEAREQETIEQLLDIESSIEDNKWEDHSDCSKEAVYLCKSHKGMIICGRCEGEEHSDWDTIKYHTQKDLSSLTVKLIVMVNHIVLDCKKFKKSAKVAQVSSEIDEFSKEVEDLRKKTLDRVKTSKEEYRKNFSKWYQEVQKARNKLLNSDMVKGPYSELLTLYHLMDLSIIPNKKI